MTTPAYPCLCCGYLTRSEAASGTYEICPVCWWEDDPVQAANVDRGGGANEVSLAQARENFRKLGASDPRDLAQVRAPLDHERPRG